LNLTKEVFTQLGKKPNKKHILIMDVTIPTSWKDINIDTYIKLVPVLETEQEPITRIINILCVLTGKKREEVREIQLTDYHKIMEKMEFLQYEVPTKLESRILNFNGNYYEFKLNAENLLFGEYINAMEILNSKSENAVIDNLDKILASICRPVEKKLGKWKEKKMTSKLLQETIKVFREQMSIADAYPIAVFFCNHSHDLMNDIKTSLITQAAEMAQEVEMDLATDGAGGV